MLKQFVDAIAAGDQKQLRASLAPTVTIEGLELSARNCQRSFGTRRIKAAKRDALAKCLVSLATPPTWTVPMVLGSGSVFTASIPLDCVTYEFELRARKGVIGVSSISAFTVCAEGGEEGGVVGGFMDGTLHAPPPPPPSVAPPPPRPPLNVPPTLLEGSRIAGNKIIVPDDATKAAITDSGKAKIIASFKLCVDPGGAVTTITLLKPSGFAAYDAKLRREMQVWKYKPYLVNGKAVPVCTAVTFIYSQQ